MRPEGLIFDVGSLFESRLALHDQRDRVVCDFFTRLPETDHTVELALDGKSLRGAHLLAAYFPGEGLALAKSRSRGARMTSLRHPAC